MPATRTESLSHRRKQLNVELAALTGVRESSADAEAVVELDQTRVGRISRMDAMRAQAMSMAAGVRREDRIRLIQAALRRLDDDEYGDCRDCGEMINPKRLDVDPAALLCIDCASQRESASS